MCFPNPGHNSSVVNSPLKMHVISQKQRLLKILMDICTDMHEHWLQEHNHGGVYRNTAKIEYIYMDMETTNSMML